MTDRGCRNIQPDDAENLFPLHYTDRQVGQQGEVGQEDAEKKQLAEPDGTPPAAHLGAE